MEWKEVKRGWVYQRKNHLLGLTHSWSPRYLVVYQQPIPCLALYEQRSDAQPPYRPSLHWDLSGLNIRDETVAPTAPLTSALGRLKEMAKGTASAIASRRNSVAPNSNNRKGGVDEEPVSRDRQNSNGSAKTCAPPPPNNQKHVDQLICISRPANGPHQPAQLLILACISHHERVQWLDALRQAQQQQALQPEVSHGTRSRTRSNPAPELPNDPMDVVSAIKCLKFRNGREEPSSPVTFCATWTFIMMQQFYP